MSKPDRDHRVDRDSQIVYLVQPVFARDGAERRGDMERIGTLVMAHRVATILTRKGQAVILWAVVAVGGVLDMGTLTEIGRFPPLLLN
jgi:hypothetical protein